MAVQKTTPDDGAHTAAFDKIRRMTREGDNEGAVAVAESIADSAEDPLVVGRALMLKLGRLFNLGRTEECPAVLDRAFDALAGYEGQPILAHLHALAGIVAAPDSLERCVRHLVQGARVLDQVEHPDEDAVIAWHGLAVTYSYVGFHSQAMTLGERGYLAGQDIGLPAADHALPEVAVRWALALDHRGDTDGCVRKLHEMLDTWSTRTEPLDLWPAEQHYYGYAQLRLRLLGEDVEPDPSLFDADEHGWEVADLRSLGRACRAVIEGRPQEALKLLHDCHVNPYTVGSAEVHRLRSLAHAASGDYLAALRCDREAIRVATEDTESLRDRLVDGTRAYLDHEALRRTVEQYATEALTDPLTGLPNRRHFDRWIAHLAEQRIPASVGIVDLDGFKEVNTVYGHLTGDLVLHRVAAVLARSLRRGDFVARYGGDEFVVVLPETPLHAADEIGSRIAAAVAGQEWEALAAGTPVSVTVGWAELLDPEGMASALATADRVMLGRKSHVPSAR